MCVCARVFRTGVWEREAGNMQRRQLRAGYLYSLLTLRREEDFSNVQLRTTCTAHACTKVRRPPHYVVPWPISTMKMMIFSQTKYRHIIPSLLQCISPINAVRPRPAVVAENELCRACMVLCRGGKWRGGHQTGIQCPSAPFLRILSIEETKGRSGRV